MPGIRAYHRKKPARSDPSKVPPTCAITRDKKHELLTLPKDRRSAANWEEHYEIAQQWHEDLARKGVPHVLDTEPDGCIRQIYLHRLIGSARNGSQGTHWCCEEEC